MKEINPENLRFTQIAIDLSRGLPFVEEAEVLRDMPWMKDEPSKEAQYERFWAGAAEAGFPFAKGLFFLPLSSLAPEHAVPSKRGVANWDHPNAEVLVDNFIAVMGSVLREDCLRFGDLREQVKEMLARSGLIRGSMALVFPIRAKELAIWAVEQDVERLVRRLDVEWIGLFPLEAGANKPAGYSAHYRRLKPEAFDLRNYAMPPSFRQEKGAGVFWVGYAPSLSEKMDEMQMQEAAKVPVPFAPTAIERITPVQGQHTRATPEKEMGLLFFGHLRDRRDELVDLYPVLWARLYPRRYSDRSGYLHPRQIARILLELCRGRMDQGRTPPRTPQILPPLLRSRMPHYFIAPAMFEGISQTKFPPQFIARETPLPLPGVLLVLPEAQQKLFGADGSLLKFIVVSRIRDADSQEALAELIHEQHPGVDTSFISKIVESASVAPDSPRVAIIGISESGRHIYELPITLEEDEEVTPETAKKQAEDLPAGLANAMWRLTKFVVNTLLYLNLAPEYLAKERVEKTAKPKPQKPSIDYWVPNIYGATFRLPNETTEPKSEDGSSERDGRSPRGHIRSAHWRRQHFGPGNTQTYLVRIPWTWVEGETDETPDDDSSP